MDRRETIKTLVVGGIGSSLMFTSCIDDKQAPAVKKNDLDTEGYGRTPVEEARDEKLMDEQFFTDAEMATITILSDIIMPADAISGSATDAGVPDFIEFISKDMPEHQTPLRGGISWLNHESNRRYDSVFNEATNQEQIAILDDIAYPDDVKPQFTAGASFFSRIRNLVTTGYFTSKIGIKYLGYVGNVPNVWDGVPQDVLDEHGLSYSPEMLERSVKPEERGDIMDWTGYEV